MLATSPKTATVRAATVLDVPAVIDLFCAMRQEGFWRHIPVENNTPLMGILLTHRMLTNPYSHVVVAENEGMIVGFCGAVLQQHFLYPGFDVLTEWGLYMQEEYRGGRLGGELWDATKEWAVSVGCHHASRAKPINIEHRGRIFGMEVYSFQEIGAS